MATSIRSESVLQLGKKIVEELDLNDSVDTLGRWMAHYIAELIKDAEVEDPEKQTEKLRVCCDAILKLWQHRNDFSGRSEIFFDITPILRSLKNLDPEDDTPRYFRSHREDLYEHEQDPEVSEWLKLADALDSTAKDLIRYCLAKASKNEISKAKAWTSFSDAIDREDELDLEVIEKLSKENDLLDNTVHDEAARSEIESRIKRLSSFVEVANNTLSELKKNLND
ncbi:AVAST type 3 anti-phage proein Avs3b [Rufibacter psychrotolerans]|uniref:AVAST type 3 anti-phage proein Avs3b n=1 Tax=Rufibacter psychrotolerans TaxID=2812556 RepID=UPI001967F7F1|nr:AVAST type 3 anti-phage proein Avs3b [Rufibacter sp. SYSU D00308]